MVRTVLIATLAACYAPDVRDCTVTCTNDLECAGGQTCGADHFCVAPDRAGVCGTAPSDGAMAVDARAATPHPDARTDAAVVPVVVLHVHIDGLGSVSITGGPTCASGPMPHIDCMFDVAQGVSITLAETPLALSQFQMWNMSCNGTQPTCTVVPTMPMTDVGAQFKGD